MRIEERKMKKKGKKRKKKKKKEKKICLPHRYDRVLHILFHIIQMSSESRILSVEVDDGSLGQDVASYTFCQIDGSTCQIGWECKTFV